MTIACPRCGSPAIAVGTSRHDRERLIEVLIYHQRTTIEKCACGWGELGRSHAEHVVDVYEDCLVAVAEDDRHYGCDTCEDR